MVLVNELRQDVKDIDNIIQKKFNEFRKTVICP